MNTVTILELIGGVVCTFDPKVIRSRMDWLAVNRMATAGLRVLHEVEIDGDLLKELRQRAHDMTLQLGQIQQRSSDEYESTKA
jgi:excisionase family DNA binding protein